MPWVCKPYLSITRECCSPSIPLQLAICVSSFLMRPSQVPNLNFSFLGLAFSNFKQPLLVLSSTSNSHHLRASRYKVHPLGAWSPSFADGRWKGRSFRSLSLRWKDLSQSNSSVITLHEGWAQRMNGSVSNRRLVGNRIGWDQAL